MTAEAHDAATARAETAWQEHWDALAVPVEAVKAALARNLPATGITPGPGLDAAATTAVHTLVDHHQAIVDAAQAKTAALQAEHERDQITRTLPPPIPDKPAPLLTTGERAEIRDWLAGTTPEQVAEQLNTCGEPNARTAWANQLLAWCRSDGNTAEVIQTIRAALPDTDRAHDTTELAGKENHPQTPGDLGALDPNLP